jgi:hypothetical protein
MKISLKFQVKVCALTAIFLISIASMLSAQKIAIIDAGSSGSRLYVYDITDNGKEIKILYPTSGQENASKGRALSGVANHPDSVKAFLDTMVRKYTSTSTEKIPLYVLATAGMRLVNEGTANAIYKKMDSLPKVYNHFRLHTAMTISGRYEGFYAWIAANYRHGKLGFSTSTTDKPLTYTGTPKGILEIGGASMQIAFAANKSCSTCISREGFSNIYSYSYLGGGVDRVYNRHRSEDQLTFTEVSNADNVISLYGTGLQFLGLGRPIGTVLDNAKGNSVSDYAASLQNNDSREPFHPWINAKYIAWVVNSLKLDRKLSKPNKKSDWTEGAALDILINQQPPEQFNYQTQN